MDIIAKAIEAKLHSAGLNWIKLQSFHLSTKEKTITAELILEGEPLPVSVQAIYAITGDLIRIVAIETSKKWLTEAATLGLLRTEGTFPLPGGLVGKLLKFFL